MRVVEVRLLCVNLKRKASVKVLFEANSLIKLTLMPFIGALEFVKFIVPPRDPEEPYAPAWFPMTCTQ